MTRAARSWSEADLMRIERSRGPRVSLHEPGGILTLDLAGTVGWAYGGLDDYEPLTGVWNLPKRCLVGARYAAYENELIDALQRHRPSCVVMEAPLPLPAQTQNATARQQFGLAAYTEGECYRAGVKLLEGDVGPVRQAVLGKSRWQNRDDIKPAIVAWCQAQGWNIDNHNAADAAVLWQYSVARIIAERMRVTRSVKS